jgi:hypothetical protein
MEMKPAAMDRLLSLDWYSRQAACQRAPSARWARWACGAACSGRAEHDAMEMKPAATDRLLSLDWYSETSYAPESAISSLGTLGLWSGMLGGAHQHHGSSAAI